MAHSASVAVDQHQLVTLHVIPIGQGVCGTPDRTPVGSAIVVYRRCCCLDVQPFRLAKRLQGRPLVGCQWKPGVSIRHAYGILRSHVVSNKSASVLRHAPCLLACDSHLMGARSVYPTRTRVKCERFCTVIKYEDILISRPEMEKYLTYCGSAAHPYSPCMSVLYICTSVTRRLLMANDFTWLQADRCPKKT